MALLQNAAMFSVDLSTGRTLHPGAQGAADPSDPHEAALIAAGILTVIDPDTPAPGPSFEDGGVTLGLLLLALAGGLDNLVTGTITRDENGAPTASAVTWPDETTGDYTATEVSDDFPGAVDAYTVTYGDPVTRTFTQPAVTRDENGAVTNRPAIQIT